MTTAAATAQPVRASLELPAMETASSAPGAWPAEDLLQHATSEDGFVTLSLRVHVPALLLHVTIKHSFVIIARLLCTTCVQPCQKFCYAHSTI